jgi:hypothetical protein
MDRAVEVVATGREGDEPVDRREEEVRATAPR